MAVKRLWNDRAMAALSLLLVIASVAVLFWYLLIAVAPAGPWNPLPPRTSVSVASSNFTPPTW